MLWTCTNCSTKYAVSPTLDHCPNCGEPDRLENWKVDNVEFNTSDYRERLARVEAGTADDDDRRLIKLYQREGYTPDSPEPAAPVEEGPARPVDSASRGAWIKFADEVEPNTDHEPFTKPQLIEKFGGAGSSD